VSSPAEDPSRRWPSAVAKSKIAAVSVPSVTDALSTFVIYCLRRNTRTWCVGQFRLRCDERRGELLLRRIPQSHKLRALAHSPRAANADAL